MIMPFEGTHYPSVEDVTGPTAADERSYCEHILPLSGTDHIDPREIVYADQDGITLTPGRTEEDRADDDWHAELTYVDLAERDFGH